MLTVRSLLSIICAGAAVQAVDATAGRFDIREVALLTQNSAFVPTIQPSGDAVLTVLRSVVDQNGKTIPGTASIDEAKLAIRPPDGLTTGRIRLGVTVLHAERRYLDDGADRWPLTGLAVPLSISAPDANEMNFRFDPAEGWGSFGDTLLRQPRGRSRRN